MKPRARRTFLEDFVSDLKARQALPRNIEVSELGSTVMASVYDSIESNVITESIFTGMDTDPARAVLKGLVEMVERKAFAEGVARGLRSCATERSDGFAAFPRGISSRSADIAREHALHEAIERYTWATWWDSRDIRYDLAKVELKDLSTASGEILREVDRFLPLRSVHEILPAIANTPGVQVAIFFAFLDPIGVISGGACGTAEKSGPVSFRAICELARHALAVKKITIDGLAPSTFYERRLAYFATTEEGTNAAEARLQTNGDSSIYLPPLLIDEEVPHALSDLVAVHRCFFREQPAFIGGNLERLCL